MKLRKFLNDELLFQPSKSCIIKLRKTPKLQKIQSSATLLQQIKIDSKSIHYWEDDLNLDLLLPSMDMV